MPPTRNLVDLDADKLFEDHKIEEIIEIEKLLDAEIERKRVELRSMVGDRYKDVLAASEAIKTMKTISQGIVDNIEKITCICEEMVSEDATGREDPGIIEPKVIRERELIIQIRLAICLNEEIWIALDNADTLEAAQLYLLAQHIHLGLRLTKKEYLDKIPLLEQIQTNFQALRGQIFSRIKEKLQSVEINAEETGSNLNALLLLQNNSTSELLNIFVEHRKIALNTVIQSPYNSIRLQISAMVRCLITTVHLLYDCFMASHNDNKGLIWQQLHKIIEDKSRTTLDKINLPKTPLSSYIPEIIKEFRPKYKNTIQEPLNRKISLDDWLSSTKISVKNALDNSLELITNIKGLYLIREEALKIELPKDWDNICVEANLPKNFNIWYYFFQDLVTGRARNLITQKITSIITEIQLDITAIVKSKDIESDSVVNTWLEEQDDVSRQKNEHSGLTMKTLGYSKSIVVLCENLDSKYLALLTDISQYLYGKEYTKQEINQIVFPECRKFTDRNALQKHIQSESIEKSKKLTVFFKKFTESEVDQRLFIPKSLIFARFLQAITNLCTHLHKCCTFNGDEEWNALCKHLIQISYTFWTSWVENCTEQTKFEAYKLLSNVTACSMIDILPRWDMIEIQEQTDENIFKSQIKVPLKPSLILDQLLDKLNGDLNAVLPHTLPKQVHLQFLEKNIGVILQQYDALSTTDLNQNQALQFLFDVKFLTTLCVPRENQMLTETSQRICDKLRAKIDPFDLDVFYSYLQANVKRAVLQSQTILGCLLPSTHQLANLGVSEKKEQDVEPSILATSTPSITTWFPLLPISVPSHKNLSSNVKPSSKVTSTQSGKKPTKTQDVMKSSAASLFGGLATDWFS